MTARRFVFLLGLSIGTGIAIAGRSETAQSTTSNGVQPPTAGWRKLTGNDARRADELSKAIGASLEADRWQDAIASTRELLAVRTRAQGSTHFETVDALWRLKALQRVASMPKEDRVAYLSADTLIKKADALEAQEKYAQAQPLFEKVLEICRRRPIDDRRLAADISMWSAANLHGQGKYAQAQPLIESGLEIYRRLLTDDHHYTAAGYIYLAANLNAQGEVC
jgi:tetratricopeptide (TPR) repeat protein